MGYPFSKSKRRGVAAHLEDFGEVVAVDVFGGDVVGGVAGTTQNHLMVQ